MLGLLLPLAVVTTAGLLLSHALAREEPEKALAEELKRLEGEWRITAAEQGGEAVKSECVVAFSGQKCTVTNLDPKVVYENTFSLDLSKKLKRIVLTNMRTKEAWAGVYELDGGKLRALFYGGKDAQEAPTEFKTKKGGQEVMYTYEWIKPK